MHSDGFHIFYEIDISDIIKLFRKKINQIGELRKPISSIPTSFPGHFHCLGTGEIALKSAGHVNKKYSDFVGI